MCVIIDASVMTDYVNNKEYIKPVRNWLENKGGKLVWSAEKKLLGEYKYHLEFINLLNEYQKLKIAKRISTEEVGKAKEKVEKKKEKLKYRCKSNDRHIIVLAAASGAKLLASKDKNLGTDFKKIIEGSIYKDKSHAHLLSRNRCPA